MDLKLSQVEIGKVVIVRDLECQGLIRRRMQDLGIVPGATVGVLRCSPLGDPRSYLIKGAEIALREEEASQIVVRGIVEEEKHGMPRL